MTILIWRIACLVSAGLFLVGLVALLCARLLRNKYYHTYTEDELMRKTKTTNSKNSIYFTSGETKKYIKKYVVCKSAYDKYVVCNFAKKFSSVSYYVVEYNALKKVIAVKKVSEYKTGESSKVISLNRHCAYVNVVICAADGVQINTDVIRPLSLTKIRLYSFLRSLVVFAGLFVVRHFLIELIGGLYKKFYFTDLMNYIAVGASLLLCVIGYFISVACFRRKNVKTATGGALEYEFV